MKVLVTGANGFTGSHLVRALEQGGNQVVGLVRPTSDLSRLADCTPQLIYGDITDVPVLRAAMQGADVVFHTAAYVELGLVDESQMERVNVAGTQAVLEVAQALGNEQIPAKYPKVVYCSTIGIFGDSKGQVIDETFDRVQPDFSSAYDRTKYAAQQLVNQFAAAGLPVVSILPSGILGPDDPHFGPVVQRFIKGKLPLWVGGDRITGIVHVDDLVQAMILGATLGKPGATYIISAGDLKTRDMFAILSKITGVPEPRELPELLVRVLGTVLDVLGQLLHWNPPISRERVHYLYDRCVRVDATKAKQELGWHPRSVPEVLQSLVDAQPGLTP